MGVSRGIEGNVRRGDPPHRSVHQEEADDYSIEVGLLPCLCTANGYGEDAGDEPDGALVGSRRGQLSGGINEEEV